MEVGGGIEQTEAANFERLLELKGRTGQTRDQKSFHLFFYFFFKVRHY